MPRSCAGPGASRSAACARVDGVELRARRRRDARADRPERRRQDDLLQHGRRPARARCRLGAARRRRASSACRPRGIWRQGVGRTFQIAQTFASMSVRENVQIALLSHARRVLGVLALGAHALRDEAMRCSTSVGMRGAGRAGDERARLRRRQARRAGDRARQPAAPAADGRADRRHGAARALRADGARAQARARAADRRPVHRARHGRRVRARRPHHRARARRAHRRRARRRRCAPTRACTRSISAAARRFGRATAEQTRMLLCVQRARCLVRRSAQVARSASRSRSAPARSSRWSAATAPASRRR